jgi:predicted TIM-barrel fold metal-dependent hydrolase
MEYPRVISADDHIVEPPHLWTSRLPKRYLDVGPRIVRQRIEPLNRPNMKLQVTEAADGDWADVWHYEHVRLPLVLQAAAVGFPRDEQDLRAVTFDEIRPGCYDPAARLADMDIAGIEAQVCFPNVTPVRFCGQVFLEGADKALALLCVRAYNDYILDEWCAGSGGRQIPCGIIPLWDPDLAVEEVRRVAARGMRAVCFSEAPAHLELPSIHSGRWDRFFATCEEAGIVLGIHIGSSSHVGLPSEDVPRAVVNVLVSTNATTCLIDWLFSGLFERYPGLKIFLAECQIGWIPYYLQYLDEFWHLHRRYLADFIEKAPRPPSSYFASNIYVTFFSDAVGLRLLDKIGVDNVMAETDYPHSDSRWPNCQADLQRQTEEAGLSVEDTEKLLRGNARRLFRLDDLSTVVSEPPVKARV